MCGLCGIFGSDDHWSAANPKAAISADPVARRRDRAARIVAVNDMLAGYHVKLSDWQGQAYVLRGVTGQQIIINNVTEVWAAMEKDFAKAFDPLNESGFP